MMAFAFFLIGAGVGLYLWPVGYGYPKDDDQ